MSDSDSSPKKPAVPSWQSEVEGKVPRREQDSTSETTSREGDRRIVIEQAKKFLEEEEVRGASPDKKVAFLESKGLKAEEIQELLGGERNLEVPAQVRGFPNISNSF